MTVGMALLIVSIFFGTYGFLKAIGAIPSGKVAVPHRPNGDLLHTSAIPRSFRDWIVIAVVGSAIIYVLKDDLLGRRAAERIAAEQEMSAAVTRTGLASEQYWREAILPAFTQPLPTIEQGATTSELLDASLSELGESIRSCRAHSPAGVDQDLVRAASEWCLAMERVLWWCEANRGLLLKSAEGLTADELAAETDVNLFDVARNLPPEGLSPENAAIRTRLINLDEAISKLEWTQGLLSERYMGRHFPRIAE
jgi:hypothetical protein